MSETQNAPRSGTVVQSTNRNQKIPIYRDFVLLQLGVLVFLIDQLSKYVVREALPLGYSLPYSGFFRITHTFNTGSAFGILQGQNTPLIFISFVGIIVLAVIYQSQAQANNLLRLSLGLQLGGAFGNLIDRIFRDRVTDFIDIGPWPVFNCADVSIVTGLIILAWIFLKPGRQAATPFATEAQGDTSFDGVRSGYSWCPICDGHMVEIPTGWRCGRCGVKERVEAAAGVPVRTATSDFGVAMDENLTPPFFITPEDRRGTAHQESMAELLTGASDGEWSSSVQGEASPRPITDEV